jgi:hypothetical protein
VTFTKEETSIANKHMRSCSIQPVIRGTEIKITTAYHFISEWLNQNKRRQNKK